MSGDFSTTERLDQIEQISRNARTTWFGLLGLLTFVGVTLMAHEDVAFFAREAQTQLPLVNITIRPYALFAAAPIAVAALYIYLHLYLIVLWRALGLIRQEGPVPIADRIVPWLLIQAALWVRQTRRKDGCAEPRALDWLVVAVSVGLTWIAPLGLLYLLWTESWAPHDAVLAWISSLSLILAAYVGARSFIALVCRMGKGDQTQAHRGGWLVHIALVVAAPVIVVLGLERANHPFPYPDWIERDRVVEAVFGTTDLVRAADLTGARLTPRPDDWRPFDLWLRDYRLERDGEATDQDPLTPTRAEMQRYRLWIARLAAPDFQGRDMVDALMPDSFMPGAVLRSAQMQGADLEGAQMQGADLEGAQMQGADLEGAQMQGADLEGAQMQGAVLRFAQMQGADLEGAQMQGAVLRGAQMQGAELSVAEMQGADLGGAEMQGAVLWGAEMQGAVLWGAQMQDSECTNAAFLAALVHSADVTCGKGIPSQGKLPFTVGDGKTVLPPGFWVWSCLDQEWPEVVERREEIDAAIAHHPEERNFFRTTRSQFEELLWCGPDEHAFKITYDPFERRFWKDFDGIR